MTKDTVFDNRNKQLLHLKKERERIFSLTPEKALERILDAQQPRALVHSFPEEDLYFLIRQVGPEDAIELLSLASNKQWEFIIDIESWEKDRIAIPSLTRWLQLLLTADQHQLIHWIYKEKTELLEYYLYRNIEIRIREHDQDPSDFGDDFFTLDDSLYIRILEPPPDVLPDKDADSLRKELVSKLIQKLAGYDHKKYTDLLLESQGSIPAEAEEAIYRWRNVRMVEKGFLPFEEAIGIYQPMTPQDVRNRSINRLTAGPSHQLLPVPVSHMQMLKGDNLFAQSLEVFETGDLLFQIQAELAGLCNQIISADQTQIDDREDLRKIVKKAAGYLSIGLQRLADETETPDVRRSAALIKRHALIDIFRTGFQPALLLKWRAEKWRSQSWFERVGLPMVFWDESWLGLLGGLLIKKPLFYDNFRTGGLYREFETMQDIRQSEETLDEVIAFDNLLLHLDIPVAPHTSDPVLTYKNLVLTHWARSDPFFKLGAEAPDRAVLALTFDELKTVFGRLWTMKGEKRIILDEVKTAFLNYLSKQSGLVNTDILNRMGQPLEDLFSELESEYGAVEPEYLDPRYIRHFLVQK